MPDRDDDVDLDDPKLLDDPEQTDNLVALAGLRQRGRARYNQLTSIEADTCPKVPLTGPIEQVGVLRRRETGSALFEGLTPALYIVRLDDGHLAHGLVDEHKLDDLELAQVAGLLARLQARVAGEGHRRALARVTGGTRG